MTDNLPISIFSCEDLIKQFSQIQSVCNRLEAQFNFQTMTANWYSDENNILTVCLRLETPLSFVTIKKINETSNIIIFSDDAYCFFDDNEKEEPLICYLAITEAELTMLDKENRLLFGLLEIKIKKVLNLIAKQFNLDSF